MGPRGTGRGGLGGACPSDSPRFCRYRKENRSRNRQPVKGQLNLSNYEMLVDVFLFWFVDVFAIHMAIQTKILPFLLTLFLLLKCSSTRIELPDYVLKIKSSVLIKIWFFNPSGHL